MPPGYLPPFCPPRSHALRAARENATTSGKRSRRRGGQTTTAQACFGNAQGARTDSRVRRMNRLIRRQEERVLPRDSLKDSLSAPVCELRKKQNSPTVIATWLVPSKWCGGARADRHVGLGKNEGKNKKDKAQPRDDADFGRSGDSAWHVQLCHDFDTSDVSYGKLRHQSLNKGRK